jgi:DNA polymerase-3 subunit alpha
MKLPEAEDWNMYRKLAEEKELLGFYLSGHPLNQFEKELQCITSARIADVASLEHNDSCIIGGILTSVKVISDRNNNPMAFLTIEDFSGTMEGIVFSESYRSCRNLIVPDSMVVIKGKVSLRKDEEPKIICEEITALEKALSKYARSMVISIDVSSANDDMVNKICSLIQGNAGKCHLYFDVKTTKENAIRFHSKKYMISPEKKLVNKLQEIVGENNIAIQ